MQSSLSSHTCWANGFSSAALASVNTAEIVRKVLVALLGHGVRFMLFVPGAPAVVRPRERIFSNLHCFDVGHMGDEAGPSTWGSVGFSSAIYALGIHTIGTWGLNSRRQREEQAPLFLDASIT